MIPAIAGLTAPARTATPAAKESGAQGFEARLNSAPEASKPGASAKPAEAVAPKADARDSAGTEAEAPVDPGAVPAEDAAEHSTDASARAEAETAAASAEAALLPEISPHAPEPAEVLPAFPSTPLVEALRVSLTPAAEADALAEGGDAGPALALEADHSLESVEGAAAPLSPLPLRDQPAPLLGQTGAEETAPPSEGDAEAPILVETRPAAPAPQGGDPANASAKPQATPTASTLTETAELSFADLTTESLAGPTSTEARPAQPSTAPAAPAAATAAQTAERPTPPLLRNVLDRLSEIEIGEGKTRLLLRPQGLGVLEIDLARMVDGRLHLAIRAENPMLLEALKQDGSALGTFMSERGFDLSGGQPDLERYTAAEPEGLETAEADAETTSATASSAAQPVLRADRLDLLT